VPGRASTAQVRTIVNEALDGLASDFDRLCGWIGRPGVPRMAEGLNQPAVRPAALGGTVIEA
jgi:hypothetical protein